MVAAVATMHDAMSPVASPARMVARTKAVVVATAHAEVATTAVALAIAVAVGTVAVIARLRVHVSGSTPQANPSRWTLSRLSLRHLRQPPQMVAHAPSKDKGKDAPLAMGSVVDAVAVVSAPAPTLSTEAT